MAELVKTSSRKSIDTVLNVNLIAVFFPLLVVLELESDVAAHLDVELIRQNGEVIVDHRRCESSRVNIALEKGCPGACPRVSLPCRESRATSDKEGTNELGKHLQNFVINNS